MEETVVPKRPREESQVQEDDLDCEESSKRHKPYNLILSLLESDQEEDSTQDLSPLMTTLQHEIITCASHDHNSDTLLSQPQNNSQDQENLTTSTSTSTTSCGDSDDIVLVKEDNKGDEKERVMRHLLEASDDELGIPSRVDHHELLDFGEDMFSSTICDGFWELEDETANDYALLQSELFL